MIDEYGFEYLFAFSMRKDVWDSISENNIASIYDADKPEYAYKLKSVAVQPDKNRVILDITFRALSTDEKYKDIQNIYKVLVENIEKWEKEFYIDSWATYKEVMSEDQYDDDDDDYYEDNDDYYENEYDDEDDNDDAPIIIKKEYNDDNSINNQDDNNYLNSLKD